MMKARESKRRLSATASVICEARASAKVLAMLAAARVSLGLMANSD